MVSESSDGQRNGTKVACKRKHSGHRHFLHMVECFLIYSLKHSVLKPRYYRTWMPSATALTSFLCYTLIFGQRLTVSKAFTSIALFNQLQSTMISLPRQFFAMLHGKSFIYRPVPSNLLIIFSLCLHATHPRIPERGRSSRLGIHPFHSRPRSLVSSG